MTPQEISILDVIAERDKTTAAQLGAISDGLRDLREEVRAQREQLVGVATGAEIGSLRRQVGEQLDGMKRQVNAEVDALDIRLRLAERRLDAREVLEAEADRRQQRRAWMLPASAQVPVGLVLLMAGAAIERLVS